MLHTNKSVYSNPTSRVEVNGALSDTIEINQGVAQGCVLSPLFFDVYVDDLLETLRGEGLGMQFGRAIAAAYAFADDLCVTGSRYAVERYIDSPRMVPKNSLCCERQEVRYYAGWIPARDRQRVRYERRKNPGSW